MQKSDAQHEKKMNDKQTQPNESSSVNIQGHIKIFDPNTKEIIVSKRS